ncbi:MAG: AbrB/MazE/SpoVT family DNA-binding domain-containing protein [Promethearchaeia archaeon]
MKTKIGTRKVWEVGGEYPALVTTLPKVWIKSNDLDKNSKIKVEMNEKGHLIIKPIKECGNSG